MTEIILTIRTLDSDSMAMPMLATTNASAVACVRVANAKMQCAALAVAITANQTNPRSETMKVEMTHMMGTDLTVVNAARVSYGKHTETLRDQDVRLIHYLAKHGHWSPFAHPQASFRISPTSRWRGSCSGIRSG